MSAGAAVRLALACLGPLLYGQAAAQAQEPGFTAPPGSDQATPSPVHSGKLPVDSGQLATSAVDVYRRICLAAVGQPTALIDAAINAGLAPYFGGAEGEASLASLLGDAPGQVFAVGGSSDVLLAIGNDGHCTVWAQRADGPQVKQAFVAAIEALRVGGAAVRATRDRTVQRGGWRHQLGYHITQPSFSFSADAVTLITSQPGLQVLRATVGRGTTPAPVVRETPR